MQYADSATLSSAAVDSNVFSKQLNRCLDGFYDYVSQSLVHMSQVAESADG